MSIKIMTAIWALESISPTQKLILLAMADWSNDEGRCWPSMATLRRKTGISERALQSNIHELVRAGYIVRQENPGKGVNYWVKTDPRIKCTPAADAPPPPHGVRPTPAADAPNTPMIHHLDTSTPKPPKKPEPKTDTMERLWAMWPKPAKTRSSKADVLKALAGCKIAEGDLMRAACAYLASADAKKDGGAFVPGLHRWIKGRAETWAEEAAPAPAPAPTDQPRPPQWMIDACWAFKYGETWRSVWGPEPDQPGCKIDPALMTRMGINFLPQTKTPNLKVVK